MLNFKELIEVHNIRVKGIIQLGAHFGQEIDTFISMGVSEFVLVEPQNHAFEELKKKSENRVNALVFKRAVSNYSGFADMECDVINQGQSSSLLSAKEHLQVRPDIEFTRIENVRVDMIKDFDFDHSKYNVLYMDLQGNELNALLGAGDLLKTIDAIFTEVNFKEMYEGCVLLPDLNSYLAKQGFKLKALGENLNNQGWSDGFYIKAT